MLNILKVKNQLWRGLCLLNRVFLQTRYGFKTLIQHPYFYEGYE